MQFRWRTPQMEASLAARENTPQRRDQPIEFDRRGIELVTPSGNRLFALARQRVRGQNDHRDVAGLRIALQSPRGFPAVDDGHFEVIRMMSGCSVAAISHPFWPSSAASTSKSPSS